MRTRSLLSRSLLSRSLLSRNLLLASIPTVALMTFASGERAIAAVLSIGTNFAGATSLDARVIPADPFGAVSANHIVQVTNGAFAIYDKQGKLLQRSTLDGFFAAAGLPAVNASSNFDPRVMYDPTAQRWFATAADRTDAEGISQTYPLGNRVVLAVSKSVDPTQGWEGLALPVSDAANPRFADFPVLGITAQGVNISVKLADANLTNVGSTLISIPKVDLLGVNPTADRGSGVTGVPSMLYGDALVPVTDFDNPGNGTVDFVSPINGQQITRSTLSPQSNGSELSNPIAIKVNPYARPLPGIQPGGVRNLEAGEDGFGGSVIRVGNSIWGVQGSAAKDNSRNVLRWYELDAKTNQVKQQGEIGDANHDYLYPSLAVNRQGDVVIGFNRSGSQEFISSYAIAGSTQNGKTTFGQPLLLKAGQANYAQDFGSGRNRWGDYSATVIDPSDPLSFWTFQQVAGQNNQWFTQVSQIRLGPVGVKTPEPTTIAGIVLTVGILGRRRQRLRH